MFGGHDNGSCWDADILSLGFNPRLREILRDFAGIILVFKGFPRNFPETILKITWLITVRELLNTGINQPVYRPSYLDFVNSLDEIQVISDLEKS
jgi:hypothetical protein